MRMSWQFVCITLGSGLTACGGEPAQRAASSPARDSGAQSTLAGGADAFDTSVDELPAETAPTANLPSWLSCVSGASRQDGEQVPFVWRLQVTIDGDDANVDVQRGPQFWSHSGQWLESEPARDTRNAQVTSGDLLQIREGQAPYGLQLVLERNGQFWFGSMADQHNESISEDALNDVAITCWDENEVFEWAWAGEPGAFTAAFQWHTGRCTDAAGNAALNEVPIEFVRETGFAVCADLRGAALNGDDLSYPDLQYWFLEGADLTGATLYFANLTSATLSGARLGGLQFGYATVSGTVDDFTELPSGSNCEAVESPWGGSSTTCTR